MKTSIKIIGLKFTILLLLFNTNLLHAQEMEPRSLTNVPVGTNFALLGYGYAQGNILLDPVVPIEDLDAKLHAIIGSYVRSISILGKNAKLNLIVPFAAGDWTGKYDSQDTSTSRTGFGDPKIGISYNFIGSPALKASEYKDYKQKTIFGFNIWTSIPIGQYYPDKLLNLGSNRFTIRSQIGASHRHKRWFFEGYISAWFFTVNKDFFGGNELTQYPFLTGKIHVIRSFNKGIWLAADGGYGFGGRTQVNGVDMDTRMSTFRFGLTFAAPFAKHHSLKLKLTSSRRLERGPVYEAISIAYQYMWGKRSDKR